ncbi:hypothetical protein PR202_gb21739 [Eleusine coracana subsp. coracana]|uniref:4-alpha-glucanotransferase n=1 Tax=Eleusine coracana subsp. coracana TaxID=191504 RepID=A0AAV5FEV2_ELECO|nr:hypothetical protein PR202_gb21739 [Eleusine coracana subsp. coracana]
MVLPLVPPGRTAGEDGSPYSGQDANCGNTLLISLEELVKDGLLMKDELPDLVGLVSLVLPGWLEDAALFAAIDKSVDAFSWYEWPEPLKNRHLGALEDIYQKQNDFIEIFMAQQFLFQRQWQRIRTYAQKLGISIMGDMPIYVGYHSADVWANRKSFLLDKNGFPTFVSGVPPDAFSETGQLWNSPLYDWKAMEADGFTWWVKRIKRALDLYDEFRIDHFRGLAGFWAVPSAFGGGSDNPHLPHNHELDQVVYTGTHDNDTVLKYLPAAKETDISWALITAALSSVARTSMVTIQDILGLDSSARMNTPATQKGNWKWRIPSSVGFDSLSPEASKLKELLAMYNRL